MAANVETERGEAPRIQERPEEFIINETLKNTGVQVVQKTFKAQVHNDKGTPLIQTPPAQVITVSPPAGTATLTQQAKGPISLSLTWLAAFWLRIIKKAMHFGWQIVARSK